MIVVAIIGVLAALAIYGVRRYLANAKASEAKQAVGNIARSAHAAYEREVMPSQDVNEGNESVQVSHALCLSALSVPAKVPAGKKYQPNTANGKDFGTGSDSEGWKCLRFRIDQPVYYQYLYTYNGSAVAPNSKAKCSADCYEAGALGDLNANGLYSRFAKTGQINTKTKALKAATNVYVENEAE